MIKIKRIFTGTSALGVGPSVEVTGGKIINLWHINRSLYYVLRKLPSKTYKV